jgi:hypothetical protein
VADTSADLPASLDLGTKGRLLVRSVPQRVVCTANGVPGFARRLFDRAFSLSFGVTGDLADGLLDRALHLLGSASNPVIVHVEAPQVKGVTPKG